MDVRLGCEWIRGGGGGGVTMLFHLVSNNSANASV